MHGRPILVLLKTAAIPIAILIASGLGFAFLLTLREKPAAAVVSQPEIIVETVAVEPHDRLQIEADGQIVPHRELTLSAEVAGRVTDKAEQCRSGSYVKAGQLLLNIDPRDFELEVRRLTLEVKQVEAAVSELRQQIVGTEDLIGVAQEAVEIAQRGLQRQTVLASGGATSQSSLDRTRQAELATRNELLKLQNTLRAQTAQETRLLQSLKSMRTELEKAQLDLQRTQILAPVDGVIVADPVEEGGYVVPGTPVAIVLDTSSVDVSCTLRMDELRWLWREAPSRDGVSDLTSGASRITPTPATVIYRMGGAEFAWDGVLARYEGAGVDERTRTVACRVRVADPRQVRVQGQRTTSVPAPPALLPGMFVTVIIHAETPPGSLLRIPEAAVRPGNRAWVVREGRLQVESVDVVRLVERDSPEQITQFTFSPVTPAADPPPAPRAPVLERTPELEGLVVSHRDVAIAAQVAGSVLRKSEQADAGQMVTKGAVLFEIDSQDYQLQVAQAEAQLEEARSALAEADVDVAGTKKLIELAEQDLALQQAEVERQQRLEGRGASAADIDLARSNEVTARRTLLTLQNQLAVLQITRERLQQALELAEVRLEKLRLELERTRIVAPFDAIVVEDHVEQGDYVQPGTSLVTLSDTSAAEVRVHLQVYQLAQLINSYKISLQSAGDEALESVYELPDTPATVLYRIGDQVYAWEGRLTRTEGIGVEPSTRTMPCRVRVDEPRQMRRLPQSGGTAVGNAPPALLRGMYVSVLIHAPLNREPMVKDLLTLDATAVERFMALIDATSSGLQSGDRVVVTPLPRAENGMVVSERTGEL